MVWIILIIFVVIVLILSNIIIKARNKVLQARSGIDVYLNQRFDLIPNLVECVKSYSAHEKAIFENVAALRASYINNQKKPLKEAEQLNNSLTQLLATAEDNPNLKADSQYLKLQKTLTKLESQLQAARRIYNVEVTNYNTTIETIPINIIAKIFGFKEEGLFVIEDYKKGNIDINI